MALHGKTNVVLPSTGQHADNCVVKCTIAVEAQDPTHAKLPSFALEE